MATRREMVLSRPATNAVERSSTRCGWDGRRRAMRCEGGDRARRGRGGRSRAAAAS